MRIKARKKTIPSVTASGAGREKVVGGEAHLFKESAGIAGIGANSTFLVGNTKFTCRKHQCHRSFDADNAEKTERNIKALYAEIIGDISACAAADIFGKLIAGAAATAEFILLFHKLDGKANGRSNLDHNLGHICFVVAGDIRNVAAKLVAILLGGENAYISLAAEQNALFVIHRNTAKFLAFSAGNAGFKMQLEIKAHIYRIITLVKRYGINSYVCPQNLGAFAADICSFVDDILTAFGQKDLQIFKTVLIFYRIVYFVTGGTGSAQITVFVRRLTVIARSR